MKKNILSILLLIAATAFLAACGSPEGKQASLMEEMAGIAESNKDDCGAMAEELTEFAKDNEDTFEELNKELKEVDEEFDKACGKMDYKKGKFEKHDSDECEDANKEKWDKADISAKFRTANAKFGYYTSFCADNKDVAKALGEIKKATSKGAK